MIWESKWKIKEIQWRKWHNVLIAIPDSWRLPNASSFLCWKQKIANNWNALKCLCFIFQLGNLILLLFFSVKICKHWLMSNIVYWKHFHRMSHADCFLSRYFWKICCLWFNHCYSFKLYSFCFEEKKKMYVVNIWCSSLVKTGTKCSEDVSRAKILSTQRRKKKKKELLLLATLLSWHRDRSKAASLQGQG